MSRSPQGRVPTHIRRCSARSRGARGGRGRNEDAAAIRAKSRMWGACPGHSRRGPCAVREVAWLGPTLARSAGSHSLLRVSITCEREKALCSAPAPGGTPQDPGRSSGVPGRLRGTATFQDLVPSLPRGSREKSVRITVLSKPAEVCWCHVPHSRSPSEQGAGWGQLLDPVARVQIPTSPLASCMALGVFSNIQASVSPAAVGDRRRSNKLLSQNLPILNPRTRESATLWDSEESRMQMESGCLIS